MKPILILLLTSITFALSGQVTERKASSTTISSAETLRHDLVAGKTQIDEVIAPWQKVKLDAVTDKLRKTRLTGPSGNDPVAIVKKEVNISFYRLTDTQADFFTAYVLGSFLANSSQVPAWMQNNTLQKQQQLLQLLSNVSKILNDEGISTIRKIGCSGSECDD